MYHILKSDLIEKPIYLFTINGWDNIIGRWLIPL